MSMGNDQTKSVEFNDENEVIIRELDTRKRKILGLPGWRTNAKILKMQTAAMTYNCGLELVTVNPVWQADGPPDEAIATFYPNHEYYQWFYRYDNNNSGLDESLTFLADIFKISMDFDGILGFSQGGGMLTLFLIHLNINKACVPIQFAILIGGVEPPRHIMLENYSEPLDIFSLHIIGRQDPLRERSEKLLAYFNPSKRVVLYHDEGHNIPSMRTGLYDQISKWIKSVS